MTQVNSVFSFGKISEECVLEMLSGLDVHKAPGVDGLSAEWDQF